MPKFLNVLNMNGNEIQNFAVHTVAAGSAQDVAGSIILDGTDLKYLPSQGGTYTTLGTGAGDITGVTLTADDSGTASDSTGDAELTIAGGTGITTSATGTTLTINADSSQAITALTGGDLTLYDNTNNADVSFKMGTGAAESLTIQVLNGGSNKTAEEVHFSTATASTAGNAGKMVFDVDGADIMEINDSGINVTGTLTADTSLTIDTVTLTDTELGYLDGITLGTAAASKVLTLDASGNIGSLGTIGSGAITSTGDITAGSGQSFIIGNASMSENDLEKLDGITNGTAAASKAVVLDANKNIATIGTIGCGAITSTGSSSFETVAASTAIQTALIEFTDGDDAITIADGGGITAAAGITSTAVANSFGATSFNDNNITNVGDIALDTISHDGNTIGVTIKDNTDAAFVVKQGSDEYISVDTRDSSEVVDIGTGISGVTVNIGHSTSTVAIGDNLTVAGDLTVTGTTETVNQTNLDVSDNIIGLNRGASTNASDSGIIIERGSTGDNAIFAWDESVDKFTLGTTTATPADTGNLSITAGTLVADLEGTASKATVSNSTSNTDFPVVFNDESNALLDDTAAFEYNPSTGNLTVPKITCDDVSVDGKVITMTGSSSDTATFTAGTNGTLDITTTDAGGAAANIQITADGTAELAGTTVTLDSSGGITLNADNGTISFADAGASLGTISSSGYSGNAAGLAASTSNSIGVGTIELGAASDTTIARSAAGKVTVEGNAVALSRTFLLNDDDDTDNPVSSNNNGAASTIYTITHGMFASRAYKVEIVQISDYATVYTDVTRPSNTTIVVTFAANVDLGAYMALVTYCGEHGA